MATRLFTLALALLLLSACTTVPPEQRVESDPWEPMNRTIYRANRVIDNATLKPIAKGYRAVVPGPVKKGISNFFYNLTTPGSIINNALQGKPKRAFSEFGRFVFNSTLGVGGLFDVATAGGMPDYYEDFGQTAAVWGIPSGPYVVIPFLGPRNVRDAIGLRIDLYVYPLDRYDNSSVRDRLNGLRLINIRYRALDAEKFLQDSKDPYITLRESWLQNREYMIYDGDPPVDDEYFDEFLDEE